MSTALIVVSGPNAYATVLYKDPPEEVLFNLYIGSLQGAQTHAHEFNVIVNLSGVDLTNHVPSTVTLEQFNILDKRLQSASDRMEYDALFRDIAKTISIHMADNKRVLVNCAAGINRSATAICYYFISTGVKDPIGLVEAANAKRSVLCLTNQTFRSLIINNVDSI